MEAHEKSLRDLLIGKTVKSIEFFDTDLEYVSPDVEELWIVDGGIQLSFTDSDFCFCFSSRQEFFDIFQKPVLDVEREFNLESLGAMEVEGIRALSGTTITDIEAGWNFYQEFDENSELKEEKIYMPLEIVFYFSNHTYLQVAAVDYEIIKGKLEHVKYESTGELLISLDSKVRIQRVEN